MHTRKGKKRIIFINNRSTQRIINPHRPECVLCVIEDESGGHRKEWIRPENIVKTSDDAA